MRAKLAILGLFLALGVQGNAQQPTRQEPPKQESAPKEAAKPEVAPQETLKQEPSSGIPAERPALPPEPEKEPAPQEQLQELVQRAVTNDLNNYEVYKNLTHVERVQTDQMGGKGKLKKSESTTSEIFILYGERVEHVIAKNDKPLTGDEAKKEQEKFDKKVQKLKDESPEKRRKREEKFEEDTKKDRESIADAAAAFDFKLLGEENVNGRPAYVIQGEPKPGYKPKTKDGAILQKVHGKIWIDIAASHWVKMDVEFTDTYSVGWVLARIRKGTRIQIEQIPFRENVWVPTEVHLNLDARVALFKQYFANVDMKFSDWRQFSSDAKITGFSEIDQPKQPTPTTTPAPAQAPAPQ
jgi:hypothetical protein